VTDKVNYAPVIGTCIPGVGPHRLDRLEPDHLERLYLKMIRSGSAPVTARQARRTVRTALGEAERRGQITRNPAMLANHLWA
jgi:integrase